jgi:acyl-CoA thioesterase I
VKFILIFLVASMVSVSVHAAHILVLGDSLTEGYGLTREQAFPALLETELRKEGYDVTVTNAGISGSTTAGAVSRLAWHLRTKPDIVILALGANDGLRGLPIDQMRKNLSETIQAAQKKGLRVILSGMKVPPNYGGDYAMRYEKAFHELAEKHKVPLIPFLLDKVAGEHDLNLADGVHPNEKGHVVMARTVLQYVRPLLSKRP